MIQPRVRQLIEAHCPEPQRPAVTALFERRCDCAAFHIDASSTDLLERVQMAVLRGTGWRTDVMEQHIVLASVDFRDLLMAQGFGDVSSHRVWHRGAMTSGDLR